MNIGGVYYHPTFYYESLWCLIGFIILIIIRRIFKYIKTGELTCIYVMWYSLGRYFIESLRTDSLMIGKYKVAQLVSIGSFVLFFLIYLIVLIKKEKEEVIEIKEEEKKEEVKEEVKVKKEKKKKEDKEEIKDKKDKKDKKKKDKEG